MKPLEIVEIHLETVDSTNVYAKLHRHTFDKEKVTCISAENQTAAKGRFERKWISPPRVNIYSTFYFTLPPQIKKIEHLAELMALSLTTILKNKGLHPTIKGPNDVQINQKKVAGILAEVIFEPAATEVILGIGVNVNMEATDIAKIDQPATSLKIETKMNWDKKQLLKELQYQFLLDLKHFIEVNS
jgi:BirA family biotin operon repressor/biotin-[acetyl-CoA-carboxylase] ligase